MSGITFGQFARRERLAAGLSQQTCATALGFKNRSSFMRLEQDRSVCVSFGTERQSTVDIL
jgi:transcriptional regulator with XRE-family HTH domain